MTTAIRIFVYGTLKRGYRYHQRYCAKAESVEPASVWGKLYHLSVGYPALIVPENQILAHGTNDILADSETVNRFLELDFKHPGGDWDLIEGEIVTFTDPLRDLPPIEKLEGFRPGRYSEYLRVMVAAKSSENVLPVWLYDGTSLASQGLRRTSWP